MKKNTLPDLTAEEKTKPYADYYYRKPAPVPEDVQSALAAGPIDPSETLAFEKINDLLEPGYHAKETGYCFMPDGSCYVAVLTRMPGVTGDMLDWWFSWHARESLRYKIWYPGAHAGTSVKDPERLKNKSLPLRERYYTTHYPIEDVGIGEETLSIRFMPPEEFGFDTTRFKTANVSTAICTRVGSEGKKADHTDMCHFVRQAEEGVEMRSRFWIGRRLKVRMFSDQSFVNRLANTRFIRKIVIPRNAPCQMAHHCAREYNNLAQILPDLYREYGDECF